MAIFFFSGSLTNWHPNTVSGSINIAITCWSLLLARKASVRGKLVFGMVTMGVVAIT